MTDDKQPLTNYLDLLGRVARDRVTHFEGTITIISFDLYGCVQAALSPRVDKDGKTPDGRWMDIHRVMPDDTKRSMPSPTFDAAAQDIEILGRWGHDLVTDFEGTISSVLFDLNGHKQLMLSPRVDKDGKIPDGKLLHAVCVTMTDDPRAMPQPQFAPTSKPPTFGATPSDHQHGPAEKPVPGHA